MVEADRDRRASRLADSAIHAPFGALMQTVSTRPVGPPQKPQNPAGSPRAVRRPPELAGSVEAASYPASKEPTPQPLAPGAEQCGVQRPVGTTTGP
jgi:hypothetical protein